MKRLMRLRKNKWIRDLCAETEFNSCQLIQPLFVVEGLRDDEEIPGLGATRRNTLESVYRQIEDDLEQGVRHFILFQVPQNKSLKNFNLEFAQDVIGGIKRRFADALFLWIDTCLCSHTSHGHCGVLKDSGALSDDAFDGSATLAELQRLAVIYAEAGADGISPSDMMDGRTAALRSALDESGHGLTPIMSYSSKFASHFYGPFRVAADSAPQFGDRRQYQIDVRSRGDALASSLRCAEEGADLLMVKPGLTSLDLIAPIGESCGRPVGAYQVSGEYASLRLLAEKNLIDYEQGLLETWRVFKRAGAQFIITYGAREARRLGIPT
jgi:porphobilinogen synthase